MDELVAVVVNVDVGVDVEVVLGGVNQQQSKGPRMGALLNPLRTRNSSEPLGTPRNSSGD